MLFTINGTYSNLKINILLVIKLIILITTPIKPVFFSIKWYLTELLYHPLHEMFNKHRHDITFKQ